MGNLSLPSGYPNDKDIANQELPREEKPIKPLVKSASSNNVWQTVRPFMNGGLAGVITASAEFLGSAFVSHRLIKSLDDPNFSAQRKTFQSSRQIWNCIFRSIPGHLVTKATYSAAQFGSFKSLTKKAEAAGDGMPLTLYQEACCGLTSGAIFACIGIPIYSALARLRADVTVPVAQQLDLRNVFRTIYRKFSNEGFFSLWKGEGCYANALMAYNMGMLASYNHSSNYLKESLGFGEDEARLGAGAVSAFFGAACSLPFINVNETMRLLQRDVIGKQLCTSYLDCAWRILQVGGPFKFYAGFVKYFAKTAPSIMVTWIFLEEIQKLEESMGL